MYVVLDLETSTKTSFGRKANPFDPDNYVVSTGLLYQDGHRIKTHALDGKAIPDGDFLAGCTCIIGINLTFDLLYLWETPQLKAFFKRGGRIYDVQYARYLVTGQQHTWPSMNDIAAAYGLPQKPDKIKEYWESGVDTIDIPKQELLDYLDHDLDTTEGTFKAVAAQAHKLHMVPMIREHMEGLCATIEMQYNGLYVDVKFAYAMKEQIEKDIAALDVELKKWEPVLPEELEFNWNSGAHLSALLFGGEIPYESRQPVYDENGQPVYIQKDGLIPSVNARGEPLFDKDGNRRHRKGRVDDLTRPKTRITKLGYTIEGLTIPRRGWETQRPGVFKTDEDTITTLAEQGLEVCNLIAKRKKMRKDLTTYYEHEGKGMLTHVYPDHIIHHNLNNVVTVTGRLSSSNPNLQNVSRGDTSNAKQMFTSRFGEDGAVAGADYSSLEVVIQAWLTKDPQMISDVNEGIDFHVKRLAAKLGEEYEDVLRKAKVEKIEEYKNGRTAAKEFSFQRAYGAGAFAISISTGMPLEEVKALAAAENLLYPFVSKYAEWVKATVDKNAKPSGVFHDGTELLRGWHMSPTRKRYVFLQQPAPEFLHKKGIYYSFSPTEQKNYSVQGEAGAAVMSALGMIWRRFVETDNYGGKALMTNTVHDSVTFDLHKEVLYNLAQDVERIMCSIPERYAQVYGLKVPVKFRIEFEYGPNLKDLEQLHL